MTRTLDEVLKLAASDAWDDRALAAEELGRFAGDRADAALARLLHDRRDTAATEAAARTLLARDDAASAELLLRFLGTGDDDAVMHTIDEFRAAWYRGECPGLRTRTVQAFTTDDPALVTGARELLDAMGWWDGPPPPPATIDGWNVRLTADVREPVATCDGLHYVRDGYVSGVAYLVLAAHPAEPGVALLWCGHHWDALATTRHFDEDLAFERAAFHFAPVEFRDARGRTRVLPAIRPRGVRRWLRWRG